jgi:hypothetical protein
MKNKVLRGLLYVLIGYLALVALRFLYLEFGGVSQGGARLTLDMSYKEKAVAMEMPMMPQSSVRNYASTKFRGQHDEVTVELKYEKVASLSSNTEKYEQDEQRARAVIKAHNALIQEEAVTLYDESNVLGLTIGVPPGEFDAIVADLKRVGKLENFHITKTDKTNDFLQLKAKRASLEKTRDSLIGLKAQGGKIDELVKLEQEVLSLEGKIQEFGVQLGQFDQVNEFCTVRFTLAETKPAVAVRIPHLGYLLEAISWAGLTCLLGLGIFSVGLVAVLLLLALIEKSKLFRNES